MTVRTEIEGVYEMLWDCDHCEAKGLLAKSQRHCAECGAPQNPDKRYFPKEGEAKRVDGHQYEGADRSCPSCDTPQSAKGKNCTHCGAPLDGSKEVKGIASTVPKPAPKPRSWGKILLIVGVIFLIVFGTWYRFIRTKSAQLKVTAHLWERAIGVEEYADVDEENWRNQLPTDARMPICSRKERSRKEEPTGEERCTIDKVDKKDGTFEQVKKCKPVMRSVPVEDDWCRYSVRRWKALPGVKVSGSGMSPTWPTQGLPPTEAPTTIGARRQGPRTETLTLVFDKQSCEVSDPKWRKYADGQAVKVEVRASSGKIVCESL